MTDFKYARSLAAAALAGLILIACGREAGPSKAASEASPAKKSDQKADSAASNVKKGVIFGYLGTAPLPAAQAGGFDGMKALHHTAQLVAIGPRPPASDGIHRAQDYIRAQLQSFGCAVEEDDFHASTPVGELAMKNIVAKAPGEGKGILLLLTHYDTLKMDNFVGAVDGGSSTGLMLEMARLMCARKNQPNSVWIAFVDGEEALVNWHTDNDNTYGSRQMAAKLAASGELKRIKAVILADLIGPENPRFKKDANSTPWLTNLVWGVAARLGYRDIFISEPDAIEDDHQAFLHRNVPAVDIIELDDYKYWHTPEDTMDKVSARTLSIAGHVIVESVNELQKKFH